MELKLNIYNGNDIVKTYTVQDFRLKTGVCEDILDIVEIDKFSNLQNLSDDEALQLIPMLLKFSKQFKPIMLQVFPELTEEEYRNTDMSEVAGVAWGIIMHTISSLFNISEKNVPMVGVNAI